MSIGKLFVMSGPSGTGKGTICKQLFKDRPNMISSVSMTTRSPREGEVEGINYFFVTREDFENKIENDGLLEYARVFENYYGTPRKFVMDNLEKGNDVLLEIDVQGAMQVKEKYKDAILVFIMPPALEELKNRIVGRGTETEESINRRFGEALKEIHMADHYDYMVVNDVLQEAVLDFEKIVDAEHLKMSQEKKKFIGEFK